MNRRTLAILAERCGSADSTTCLLLFVYFWFLHCEIPRASDLYSVTRDTTLTQEPYPCRRISAQLPHQKGIFRMTRCEIKTVQEESNVCIQPLYVIDCHRIL